MERSGASIDSQSQLEFKRLVLSREPLDLLHPWYYGSVNCVLDMYSDYVFRCIALRTLDNTMKASILT